MHIKPHRLLSPLLLVLATAAGAAPPLRPDHVVVVIEENRSFEQVMDPKKSDSYIHALAKRGMLFTKSYAVSHPSLPNYLALFSGSTQSVSNDSCRHLFDSDNLATALADKGLSFASYAESLPEVGDKSCIFGAYQRKHNPAVYWQGSRLPASANQRFSDFPQNFANLPTVSFVIPNQLNDMHDGNFQTADEWLKTHIGPYVEWAFKHNSLLILTWDEDNFMGDNHIATILVGPMVKTGTSKQGIDHYSVLRTLLELYELPALGLSREADPIRGVWN
jgi:acid phosphatase